MDDNKKQQQRDKKSYEMISNNKIWGEITEEKSKKKKPLWGSNRFDQGS